MEHPQAQKLPTGLAGVLNGPDDHRDSAYYSIDHASKHNSTQSNSGAVTTPGTDVSSIVDKTPSPTSTGPNTQPLNSPASGGMSVASMVSPTTQDNIISRFSQQSYDSAPPSATFPPGADSRRESVDSRLGANFGDMRLANSPYASQNQSTTSLQNSLAQQRNPGSAVDRNSVPFRFSNGYQPQRQPSDALSPRMITARTAPTITGPTLGNIARAAEPTKGQAWAFPEEDMQRIPSATRQPEPVSRQGTSFFDDSRRNSLADSIASSQYTTESRLPAGQRRLEDGMPHDFSRLSRASSDFQGVSTHHHSLQHRQLSELQDDEGGSPNGSQPYSRTPELRVSHKLAERKRRTEMKELFDTLNSRQHHDRGSKASKWEILTKAIQEDERKESLLKTQAEEIKRLNEQISRMRHDADVSHHELNTLRAENAQYRSSDFSGHNSYHGPPSAGAHPSAAPHTNGFNSNLYERPRTQPEGHQSSLYGPRPTELPPLRTMSGPAPPDAMSGVQYSQHENRPNGFRAGERF